MRISHHGSTLKIWLSARETYDWAHRAGASWPGSFLSGRRLFAEYGSNGLRDLAIDGGRGDQDCPGHELQAIIDDHLAARGL